MREPVSGYASKKDAIMAMLAEGLSDDEIVFRAKTTAGSVAAYRSQRNARGMMSREKAAKAHRIVEKAIQVMAEGIGCSPAQLHQFIKRNYFGFDRAAPEPALPPEQKVDDAEPARAVLVDTPQQQETADYEHPKLGHDHRPDSAVRHHGDRPERGVLPLGDALRGDDNPVISEPKPMIVMKLDKRPMDLTGDGRFVTLKARSGAYLALDGSRLIEDKRHAYRGTPQQAQRMRENTDPAWGLAIVPFHNQKG